MVCGDVAALKVLSDVTLEVLSVVELVNGMTEVASEDDVLVCVDGMALESFSDVTIDELSTIELVDSMIFEVAVWDPVDGSEETDAI